MQLSKFACLFIFFSSLMATNVVAKSAKDAVSPPPTDIKSATRGTEHIGGFFDVYRDRATGRVLLGVEEFDKPFLLISSLPWGVGSNDIGLDRGQSGGSQLVEFRRVGPRVLLVEDNTRFRALSTNPDEALSVRQAFAESVLWAGDIIGEGKSGVVIDVSSLLISDRHGVARQLGRSGQGKYEVDDKRSAVSLADAKSFPDNTELEALLTFKGPGEAEYIRDVTPDPESVTVRQHLSLVRLPEPGFKPRAYHPGSGAFSIGYYDYAQPLASSIDVRLQPHFRLDKLDPGAAQSAVSKPIVFYVDRGAPEPVRSALLEGANWWKPAFEKAGFKDAFRVELLPEGVDPMDVRYSLITWAHRYTRGWSYGGAIVDPRTGEIIKGSVTLGSQRVRQDILIAESLLAPYDKSNATELKNEAEQMALARLRQLAAHEVGHSLGFAHNFAASRHGNGSVMDYPHPLLKLDADGSLHLDHAYGVGVGPWDDFIVAHAYQQFAPGTEQASLAKLRADIAKAGFRYISDADARAPGDAEVDGLLWDFGADSLATFDSLLAVRRKALDSFSIGVLPPQRRAGELEARLVPVYLLHRYQTEAVARLLGGSTYAYSEAADHQAGPQVVGADRQRAALDRLVRTLSAEQLALPIQVLNLLTPPATEYARSREYFTTRMTPLFDPLSAAEAATAQTTSFLFAPERLNRLAWQHARNADEPGVGEVLDAVFRGTWQRSDVGSSVPAGEAVQSAANWVVIDALLHVLEDGKLHAQVDAGVRARLQGWQRWLAKNAGRGSEASNRAEAANLIGKYLDDPKSVKLRALPVIPPGPPI
ncbi:MAG TPA: zinc-dependent metalloprotease [Dokdonella sp.]|uniref:zinc-dependent metalloprotease n=1 Tax=Dokdonella sp. TaxID=2291710 RepID=UPI002D7E6107|nr:zinc-dependent metalloprotease [Dokdonella sp.]HET9031973.1 zinc-dependent metalloprotease [Dokdonella sp.]